MTHNSQNIHKNVSDVHRSEAHARESVYKYRNEEDEERKSESE